MKSIQAPRQSNIYRLSASRAGGSRNQSHYSGPFKNWPCSASTIFIVIRDIPLFLKIIEFTKPYMIGKYYESSLRLEQFDKASQDVLNFLLGLIEEKLDYNIFSQTKGDTSISLKPFLSRGLVY